MKQTLITIAFLLSTVPAIATDHVDPDLRYVLVFTYAIKLNALCPATLWIRTP
jgi:hypothetical protein